MYVDEIAAFFGIHRRRAVIVEMELVGFNHPVSAKTVIRRLEIFGRRPATIPELFSFLGQFTDDQRRETDRIIALGSVMDEDGVQLVLGAEWDFEDNCILFFYPSDAGFRNGLGDDGYFHRYWFLAVSDL
jgi:hypothetical protein